MKSNSEIRTAAWKEMRDGRWLPKYTLVLLLMLGLIAIFQGCWSYAVAAMDIQTWDSFLEAKAKALASGLDLTVPSRIIAIRMTEATVFEKFIGCILSGIVSFGLNGLFLRAAKGVREDWFLFSLSGFKRPLGLAWLIFRQSLQIWLWSLLFIVPGIVASYRYSQSWNLKVENPDWSAGRCLKESARLMKGHKWARFSLDCSYWRPITLVLLTFLILAMCPFLNSWVCVVTLFLCFFGLIFLGAYLAIGQAIFYLELKGMSNLSEDTGASSLI